TGFYITTNEYAFFPDNIFHAAQIYAFSKVALAQGAASVAVSQIDTAGLVNGNPGFTVWPSTSPQGSTSPANGGSEFFMSSDAAEEPNGTGSSTHLMVWTLSNTSSLGTATPSLNLSLQTLTA